MKRLLSLAWALFMILPSLYAWTLSGQRSACKVAAAPEENALEWMQYCDYATTTSTGVGTQSSSAKLYAATWFKTATLEKYKGKAISLVAIHVNSTLTDASVFVLKGDDLDAAESVSEVKVGQLAKGWNMVRLATPVAIDASERIAVGYSACDNASYPLSFDAKSAVSGTSYIKIGTDPYATSDVAWGNLMIRALVDGDPSPLGYNLVLNKFDIPRNVPADEPVKAVLTLTNNSFETIKSFTYEFSVNGVKEEKEVTLDEPILNNSTATYTFFAEPIAEETTYGISITKVNGQNNISAETVSKTAVPYDASETFERNILIEKFTGQNCGYCPGGEVSIAKAIKGMEDRVVRIDHHYGYTKDIFTIEESEKTGSWFGVNSAPNSMLDRTVQEERKDTPKAGGVVFHPGYMTDEMVKNAISRPAFLSLEIEPSYDAASREATIKVSGMSHKDMSGARLTVCLTQSGYEAFQNSGGAGWLHNDFPVDYMTEYNGDEIAWNEDGTYTCTYKYTIADKYGKVVSDADKMDVVAFAARWDTQNGNENYEVLNAACKKLTPVDTGIEYVALYDVRFGYADGSFTVNGSTLGVEVFGVNGARLSNSGLAPGIYIVRAEVDGGLYVRKMTVR